MTTQINGVNNRIDRLDGRMDELEEGMEKGFRKVYDHIYAIENTLPTLATKNDVLSLLDKTPSIHQFDRLSLRVHDLEQK